MSCRVNVRSPGLPWARPSNPPKAQQRAKKTLILPTVEIYTGPAFVCYTQAVSIHMANIFVMICFVTPRTLYHKGGPY